MRKRWVWICLALGFCGCAKAEPHIPLPKDHPAYNFYRTAHSFYVSGRNCIEQGGTIALRPDLIAAGERYQKLAELAPGLARVKDRSNEQEWITVYFMEYSMAMGLPKTCAWNTEKYPAGNFSSETGDGKRTTIDKP